RASAGPAPSASAAPMRAAAAIALKRMGEARMTPPETIASAVGGATGSALRGEPALERSRRAQILDPRQVAQHVVGFRALAGEGQQDEAIARHAGRHGKALFLFHR